MSTRTDHLSTGLALAVAGLVILLPVLFTAGIIVGGQLERRHAAAQPTARQVAAPVATEHGHDWTNEVQQMGGIPEPRHHR